MTLPTPHAELVKRLEAATGPDQELGREVLLACGWAKTCVGHFYGPLYTWHGPNGEYFKDDDFTRHDPTRSLDTALTLVAFPWTRSVDATAPMLGIEVRLYGKNETTIIADHVSEPIATCMAALKASAEEKP